MKQASGRFVLRMPPALHQRLRDAAKSQGRSLNEYCVARLSDAPLRINEESSEWRDLKDSVMKQWGSRLQGIVLFGSSSRGESGPASDVDLLIVLDSRVVINRELYRVWDQALSEIVPGNASPHFVHLPAQVEEAGGLWYEVSIDGIILYDHEGRVREFLRKIREAVSRGKLRRRYVHGHPYWLKSGSEEKEGEESIAGR
ncbi:MAG: toxin-antitoxin system HicB family antitoxin [Acidobacteriota bacterium]